jgi:hypothetical protein
MNKRSPQTAHQVMPDHYENDDIPHVLARVRFMRRFVSEGLERVPQVRKQSVAIHGAYMDLLREELAPYALDLALSLIALEDSLGE